MRWKNEFYSRRAWLQTAPLLVIAKFMSAKTTDERKNRVTTTVNQLQVEFALLKPVISASNDFAARVVFTNMSANEIRLNALFLDIPKVLLKMRHRDGTPVYPGPPGMPPLDDGETGRIVLKPGQPVTYEYTGSEFFGIDLPAGKYEVRFRYENTLAQHGDWTGLIETDWLGFEVKKSNSR